MARQQPEQQLPPVQRLRVRYAKRGRLRFTSHRDFSRAFERAVFRARVPVPLRTVTGVTGTYYFDSSLYHEGGSVEVAFPPIVSGLNTSVEQQADGLTRITKTGGSTTNWIASARCAETMGSLPSRSAIVRASRRTRW